MSCGARARLSRYSEGDSGGAFVGWRSGAEGGNTFELLWFTCEETWGRLARYTPGVLKREKRRKRLEGMKKEETTAPGTRLG